MLMMGGLVQCPDQSAAVSEACVVSLLQTYLSFKMITIRKLGPIRAPQVLTSVLMLLEMSYSLDGVSLSGENIDRQLPVELEENAQPGGHHACPHHARP